MNMIVFLQSHAGVKPTAQQTAKQHRPQEKKDLGNLQKLGRH